MMFVNGILDRPRNAAYIVALLEPNRVRAEFYNAHLEKRGQARVPVYKPGEFEEMVKKEGVETVVVTCIDALHEGYIVKALKMGGGQRLRARGTLFKSL